MPKKQTIERARSDQRKGKSASTQAGELKTTIVSPPSAPRPVRAGGRSIAGLIGFLCLAFLAPLARIWIDPRAWYPTLVKPSWAPPGWIFGPVWTLLYALMAIAAWGVWKRRGWSLPLALWLVQLALNAAWTPIFFGLRQPGWALAEIVVLWLAVAATAVAFARVTRWSAWLLAPYLVWVGFATALNCAIWRLNP